MAKKLIFFILAIIPVALAQDSDEEYCSLEILKNLTDGGTRKISETMNVIYDLPQYYHEVTAERFECLQWECVVQEECLNKSTTNTVIKGLLKSNKLISFQCIANGTRETLEKLNSTCARIPEDSETVLKNGLNVVMPYAMLIPGFNKYVQDLYHTKKEELIAANKEETKKAIVLEVEKKIKYLFTVLEQINEHIEKSKHSFFETYINFVYGMENSLRKIQRDGSTKILKCIT